MIIKLPWPPSVNVMWRAVNGRNILSAEGRAYRELAAWQIKATGAAQPMTGRLDVRMRLHPPDNRRRDIDNVCKALLDAMQTGGVYQDDSQIDRLEIIRSHVVKNGRVVVCIQEFNEEKQS